VASAIDTFSGKTYNAHVMSKTRDSEKTPWYALYVRHQNENKVARLLQERLGIQCKTPGVKLWRKTASGVEYFTRPFLHTYVFISANLETINWKEFYSISGIISLVRDSSGPAQVPERQIMNLEAMAQSKNPVHKYEYIKLNPNDMVQVMGGPLKGAFGHFVSSDSRTGLFVVSIDMFNRALVTQLESSLVRPC